MKLYNLEKLALAGLVVAALLACKGGEKKSEGSSTAAAGEKIGIPECDEYIEKMTKCLDKVPEAAKPGMKSALETSQKAWKEAAANEAAKPGLASGCKSAVETSKSAYAAMGCEF